MSNDFTLEEAKELLLIDKHNLDIEVELQSTIADRIGEKMVEMESLRDAAKENVAVVDAQIADEIRREVEDAGNKITEGKLTQQVLIDDKHEKVMKKYLDLKKDTALWKILREDFVGRAFMVSQMCGLYESEYFSRESIKSGSKVNAAKMRFRETAIQEKNEQRVRVRRDAS